MRKIETLTAQQEQRLIEFRDEWRDIGTCCEPADFETGDRIIRGFYARLNKEAPIILHFSSPAICELAVNFVFAALANNKPKQLYSQLNSQLDSQLRSQLRSQLSSQLRSQLSSQLHSQLHSQLYSQLDSQLYSQLRSQLNSQLYSQLNSQLYSQLYSQLNSQLYSQLRSQLNSQLYSQLSCLKPYFISNRWGAQHWCAWEAFYLFGAEIGVKYSADDLTLLQEWGQLSQSIGWWAPWDGICFVSDRPRRVSFDQQNLLHNETGKAVVYSDGWGVSSWHGVRVPDHWIENRVNLDPVEVLKADNVEQRAAGMAIVGWPKAAKVLNRKIIDGDPETDMGALVELTMPGLPAPGRFLMARCPRNGTICEGVPRISDIDNLPIDTVIAAQAWRVGDPQSEYEHPSIRT